MKRFFLLCISFIVFLTAPPLHAAKAEEPSDHGSPLQEILILNSYHPGFAWSDDEQAGIIDVFRGKDKNWLPVIEYLDLKRLPDGRHLAELKQLFRRKYQNKKFSAVIAMDNPALGFAIDNQAELFGNAPIVFCGINNYTPSLLKGRSEVTGIVEAIDLAGTIEVMLRLHPATQEIFSPHDYTVSGLAMRKELEALIPRFRFKVRFRFPDPLTMEELLKELERLPGNSLVLPISFITDKSGRTFGMTEAAKLFSEHSPVPVYSVYKQRLGFGIVGGKLLSARIHGTNAGRIALRVLAGEKASAIPIVFESDSQFMFDYKVMSHFGIPLSALPEGSTVINKPVSFYAVHRLVIQVALGVIAFLAVVISLLMINIIQRGRSAIVLRASETKYYDLYENAPDMYLSVDAKTVTIMECNNTLVETLGYAKEDIVGRSIYEIYHPDCKADVKRLFQEFAATGEIHDAERMVRRKDGGIIYVGLNASAVRDKEGKIILCRSVWRNITERKKAEAELLEKSLLNQTLLDAIPCVALLLRPQTREIIASNAAAVKVGALPGTHCFSSWGQRQYPCPWCLAPALWATGEAQYLEVEALGILWDAHWIPVAEDLYMHFAFDITERKQMMKDLRRSEENFRLSLDDSPLGVRIVTIEGETIYANRAILNIYGYDSIEEFRVTLIENRYTPESYAGFQIRKEKRRQGVDGPSEYGIGIIRKNGEVRHLQVFRKEILWNGERQFQVIYNDITEHKRAEEDLLVSREQLRAFAGRLQAVREEERTQIAREIHDELGGALTGLKIDFSLLTRTALKIENGTVRTSLLAGMNSMTKSIDATTHTVRRIAMELRPGILDDLGLVAALEWQLKDFEKRTGIRCEYFPPGEDISLDADLSTALFRIFQEALTNVVRHSGATEVHVRLRADADSPALEVEDNGKGIEKENILSSKSLGFLGMRERTQMFGGRITVTGTPGIGTKVTVEIPPVEKRKMDRDQEGAAG